MRLDRDIIFSLSKLSRPSGTGKPVIIYFTNITTEKLSLQCIKSIVAGSIVALHFKFVAVSVQFIQRLLDRVGRFIRRFGAGHERLLAFLESAGDLRRPIPV